MSKTYHRNKRLEFNRNIEACDKIYDDGSDTAWLHHHNAYPSWEANVERCSKIRHKRKTLQREFTKFGIVPISKGWKNPVGERHEQSSRLHLVKYQATHKRRHKMKTEASRIIKEAIGE